MIFIRNNIEKWQRAEQIIDNLGSESLDDIASAYTTITTDLAFSRTHYPKSRLTPYLNDMAVLLHNAVYGNRKERWSRIVEFWSKEVPLALYDARRLLLMSFVVFVVSALIGVVSQLADPDFARIIMGDRYVNMTLDNIDAGNPMGVYGSDTEMNSFILITLNNVRVAFNTFALGLLTSLGTGYVLLNNGVMIGCFQTFFAQHGLMQESFLTIWQHGTLEISAIIVAGAAGMALGNGWLFPGTYTRMEAFRRAAKRGLKIVVGTVPVFILAGFIEGFITRHTDVSDVIRIISIIISLSFVIFYYIVLPRMVHNRVRGRAASLRQSYMETA